MRVQVYGLREEEDGWSTVSEAQNAAATRALFQVGLVNQNTC